MRPRNTFTLHILRTVSILVRIVWDVSQHRYARKLCTLSDEHPESQLVRP